LILGFKKHKATVYQSRHFLTIFLFVLFFGCFVPGTVNGATELDISNRNLYVDDLRKIQGRRPMERHRCRGREYEDLWDGAVDSVRMTINGFRMGYLILNIIL